MNDLSEPNSIDEAYKQAQSFYNFLYLIVILILWGWKFISYDGGQVSSGFEAIKAMERALPPELSSLRGMVATSVFWFLIISNIRLFLGAAYCNRDNSFALALLKESPNSYRDFLLIYSVVELLSIIALLRSSVVSISYAWIVPALVFL
jgi:hypothetical protein